MVLGALWYSPLLFGNVWMKSLGKTAETLDSPTKPMIASVIASLMTAIGVALLLSWMDINTLVEALALGVTLAVLIIFPALLSDNLFCGWGTTLLLIQSGYRGFSVILIVVAQFTIQ